MDLALFIKSRLKELGLDQKDLAADAQVTESYISQLLARKKIPPSAGRTEIYARMSRFLKLPEGELLKRAELQRRERLKKLISEPSKPLHAECRELILAKCAAGRRTEVRVIFERESFGELERMVTQTFLKVAKRIVTEHLTDEGWLETVAGLGGRSSAEMGRICLRFSRSAEHQISGEICALFLAPLIDSWDIDLTTFRIDLFPSRKLTPNGRKRFEFMETGPEKSQSLEPGLQQFLANATLSGDITDEELAFLKALKLDGRRPTSIYYHRELQNLRDPLHFAGPPASLYSGQKKG